MRAYLAFSSVLALATFNSAFAANVQKPGLTVPPQYAVNKQAVIEMFTETYEVYRSSMPFYVFSCISYSYSYIENTPLVTMICNL